MFELSIRAVNEDQNEDQELSNVFFEPEIEQIEGDSFEVSSKGETASQCQSDVCLILNYSIYHTFNIEFLTVYMSF